MCSSWKENKRFIIAPFTTSQKEAMLKTFQNTRKQLYFLNKGISVKGSDLLPPCLNKSVTAVCTIFDDSCNILTFSCVTWICFKGNSLFYSNWSSERTHEAKTPLCCYGKSPMLWVICLPFSKNKVDTVDLIFQGMKTALKSCCLRLCKTWWWPPTPCHVNGAVLIALLTEGNGLSKVCLIALQCLCLVLSG